MSFYYKNTDITTIITSGGTSLTGLNGITYNPTSYSYALPYDFGYNTYNNTNGTFVGINTYAECYSEAKSVAGTYIVTSPANHNHIRVMLIGGGGGGGGGGGCGKTPGGSRVPSAKGGWGQVGDYTATSNDIPINTSTPITITVGAAGTGGLSGNSPGPSAGANAPNGAAGNAGGLSKVTFSVGATSYSFVALGGLGGAGGGGSNSGGTQPSPLEGTYAGISPGETSSPNLVVNYSRTDPGPALQSTTNTIPNTYIPLGWPGLNSTDKYSGGYGRAGSPGLNQTPTQATAPGGDGLNGYVKIYFLKQ